MTDIQPVTDAGPPPTLSIIVISYNTRELTLECLRSVAAETTRTAHEVIVVDNDSHDGSADAIAAAFPAIRLIRSTDNLGFAGANNLAAQEARGELLLLLNPDTIILDGAIDALVDFARAEPQAQMWGGRTLFPDGSLNDTFCYRDMSVWTVFCRFSGLTWLFPKINLFSGEAYGVWRRDQPRRVDIITGCFLMLPTALWRRLGGFDLSFVMYAEEADLCVRARALGATPMVTPAATIVHYGGASESIKAERVMKVFKGKITLIRKHWPQPARWIGETLFMLVPWTRRTAAAALAPLSSRAAQARAFWGEVWTRRSEWRDGYPLF